jgi:DHA2 family methylenomycin A resistance protein-like MFS transporter
VPALQWIVNAYTLSFSILLLSAGVLGDHYGNRNFLILGYAIFFIGSLSCGAAASVPLLLAARLLQGAGAALVVPNSLAAINAAFPDDRQLRLTLISIWIACGGAALTCGPILGGLINSVASWRWIFFMNLPICALGGLLTARYVVPPASRKARRQDWLGQGLILAFATSLLVLIINYAQLSPATRLQLVAVAAIAYCLFIRVERRVSHAAVPLAIFRNAGLQKALIYGGLVNFVYFGIVFFAGLYFQRYLRMTVLEAGLSFIPITLPLVVSTLWSGRISRAHGPERAIAIGFAFMIPGLLCLALPVLHTRYVFMAPALALTTFGIGFIPPMVTAIAMLSVGSERGGMVSAVLNFFRQISGAFGVAVFGVFLTSGTEDASYGTFGIALVAVALALSVAIGYFARIELRGPRGRGAS